MVIVFFKQKTAYVLRIIDWSSDVCSSDLITPMGETATFAATLKGSSDAKPILLLGHMDVVEADAKDWTRDPFVSVEENGYIFGRGSEDNKFDVAMMVDRKSVGKGKSVSVRVGLGGCR